MLSLGDDKDGRTGECISTPKRKWLSQPVVAKDVASGENKPTSHLRGKAQSGIETKDLAAWRPARFNYFTALTDSIFSKVKGARNQRPKRSSSDLAEEAPIRSLP